MWPWCLTDSFYGSSLWPCAWVLQASFCRRPVFMTSGNQSIVKFQTLASGRNCERETRTPSREASIVAKKIVVKLFALPDLSVPKTKCFLHACVCLLAQNQSKISRKKKRNTPKKHKIMIRMRILINYKCYYDCACRGDDHPLNFHLMQNLHPK